MQNAYPFCLNFIGVISVSGDKTLPVGTITLSVGLKPLQWGQNSYSGVGVPARHSQPFKLDPKPIAGRDACATNAENYLVRIKPLHWG